MIAYGRGNSNNLINYQIGISTVLALVLLLSIFLPLPVHAQQSIIDNISVYFVIDDSGSMETNDPEDLRVTAVKLFIALLDQGDGAAIITFADESQIEAHYTAIRDHEDKVALINSLGEIQSDGYTNMKAAFEDLLEVIKEDQSGNQKIIIFLTDGKPELRDGLPPGYEEETLELIQQGNTPVLAIGLTAGGLTPFLGRVPGAAGEGSQVIPAKTANDLLDVYLGILGGLKDRTIIGEGAVTAPGNAQLRIEPMLAQYVDSVSFIAILPKDSHAGLISPDGNALGSNEIIFNETFVNVDPEFMVLSLPAPLGGEWQMEFQGNGTGQARAILRSRLRVKTLQPGYFSPAGEPMPIVANLIIEDPPQPPIVSIGDVTFTALIEGPGGLRESLDLLYDDGTHGDLKAEDGDFTNTYVNTDVPGTYVITITGRKGVVPVSTRTQVEVIEFPKVELMSPMSGPVDVEGMLEIQASTVGGEPPELDQGDLIAIITRPDGSPDESIVLTKSGSTYTGMFAPKLDGICTIQVVTQGATYRGIPYETKTETSVDVTVIPTITIKPEIGSAADGFDLGRLLNLKHAQQVAVRMSSSSQYEETLQVSIAGIPGGQVSPREIRLAPNSDQVVVLELAAEGDLPARIYDQAELVFNTPGRAKLVNAEIPVKFEIASVLIKIAPEEVNLNNILRLGPETNVTIKAESNSPFPQPLIIASVEPDNFQVIADQRTVLADGTTSIKLRVTSTTSLDPGDHIIRVQFAQPDPIVAITPETITIRLHIPSWFERFGLLTGFLLGAALLIAGTVWAMIPSPRGQLIGREAPDGQKPKTCYLSKYIRPGKGYNKKVSIGNKAGNDIVLDHPSIGEHHAIISAGKRTLSQKIGKGTRQRIRRVKRTVPIIANVRGNQVRVNGTLASPSGIPLKRKDIVQIGEYKFEYR
jgi:hypothetical protein